jgi:hypothetical protein
MKKNILIIFFFQTHLLILAQYSNIDFVTKYNEVGATRFGFKTGVYPSNVPNTYYVDLSTQILAANSGDGTAYVLESLLRMYETTKDKAYLYEFIRHALEHNNFLNQ